MVCCCLITKARLYSYKSQAARASAYTRGCKCLTCECKEVASTDSSRFSSIRDSFRSPTWVYSPPHSTLPPLPWHLPPAAHSHSSEHKSITITTDWGRYHLKHLLFLMKNNSSRGKNMLSRTSFWFNGVFYGTSARKRSRAFRVTGMRNEGAEKWEIWKHI